MREVLVRLVTEKGASAVKERARFDALLADYFSGDGLELAQSVLRTTLRAGIADALVDAKGGAGAKALRASLVRRAVERCGLYEGAAQWAVESWALALRQVTKAGCATGEGVPAQEVVTVKKVVEKVVRVEVPKETVRTVERVVTVATVPLLDAVVGLGEQYTTISAALAAVSPGATILVKPGVYRENLVIVKRAITIEGEGEGVELVGTSGAAVVVQAGATRLSNMTIRGDGTEKINIVEVQSGRAELDGMTLRGPGFGLYVAGEDTHVEVRGGRMTDFQTAVWLAGGLGVLRDCTVLNSQDYHVMVKSGAEVRISDGVLSKTVNNHGVVFEKGSTGLLRGVEVSLNKQMGIVDNGAIGLKIVECRVHDNGSAGIYTHNAARTDISDCELWANDFTAICVVGANTSPVVRRARIHDGKSCGILVSGGAKGTFEDCELWSNALVAIEVRGNNTELTVRRARIHDEKGDGVILREQSTGVFEECEMWNIGRSSILALTGAKATVRNLRDLALVPRVGWEGIFSRLGIGLGFSVVMVELPIHGVPDPNDTVLLAARFFGFGALLVWGMGFIFNELLRKGT